MAEYTPPPKGNIPFNFNTGGYQEPDWNDISLNFTVEEQQQAMANLGAAIRGVQTYQQETYTFLKYCETYIVGYSQYGVQIIKGKCHYGGIRDLGGNIGGHYPGNLPAWVRGVVYADLGAEIEGIESTQEEDLGAIIGAHQPRNLGGIIAAHDPVDLGGYIRGFDYRDLGASLDIIFRRDLPADIGGHLPEDLGGYIKPWPQRDLPGSIYGWQAADLGAYIVPAGYADLGGIIAAHRPKNLRAWIKGWVREATYDLGAAVQSYAKDDLGAFIRSTEMAQLPAYLFPIQPVDLPAFIHGWDTKDLQGIINVLQYPWNLPASINITGGFNDLIGIIDGKKFEARPTDLSAYINIMRGGADLPAIIGAAQARDLSAYIDPGKDIGNLPATIYPKMIRLTAVLDMITLNHRDMSATISIPCFYSNFKDLNTYIRPVYMKDLPATLNAKGYVPSSVNLGASWGYTLDTVAQDKFQINLTIDPLGVRTEDRIFINMAVFRGGLSLGATITPQRTPADLSAYINVVGIKPYEFESWKGADRVFFRTYGQVLQDYEDIDIFFRSMVKDYFYSSGSDVVAKVNKYTHFVTEVASHYSPAKSRRLDRRLHKVKQLYDLRSFESVDEAMRYAIWYVTTSPQRDLNCVINAVKPKGESFLSARIVGAKTYSTNNNLTSSINGTPTHSYDVILGFENDGVGYLKF